MCMENFFIHKLSCFHRVPKMRLHGKHCSHVCICIQIYASANKQLTVYYFILYILLKAFPLISSSLSSRCHLVSASLLFVPQFHCSVLQFHHFNISSNISRAESSVAELFSTTGNLGEKKVWHTNTHARTHTNTNKHLDLWFSVWIFAGEKCEMVILELWPGKEIGRSIRRTDPPPAIITIPSPVLGLMDDNSLTHLFFFTHRYSHASILFPHIHPLMHSYQ